MAAVALPRLVVRSPLRICHIISGDLWAGAEVQLATTASYLVERSDVTLTAILFNEGCLARELRALGVRVMVADERQNNAVQLVPIVARFLRENDIQIVHTHRYKENILGSLAARLAGVRHVIRTVHGLSEPMRGWEGLKFRAYAALDKAALWLCADRIVAVSNQIAETLWHSGCRRSAVVHIHNGVRFALVRPLRAREEVRQELGIGPRTLLIGTAGRLSPVKAHHGFLRAARLMLPREANARFVIVGDGPLRGELVALASQLGIDRECLFLGARTDTFDVIAAMDIFVLPSLHEGIPMALLEAMALERPVVATAVGGVPEVVTHGRDGLLVKPGDEQALADACLELAHDRRRAQTIGARARKTVEERFSHARNGRVLVETYQAIAAGAANASAGRQWGNRAGPPGVLTFSWHLTRGLVEHGIHTLRHICDAWIERQRMWRVRRQPASLATALRAAKNILVVCHGNIIRSPFAACLMAQTLGERAPVSISSAGLAAIPGKPPHPIALAMAAPRRVDLSRHTARPVAPECVAESDLIFVMDVPQLVALRRRFPEAHRKTFLLTCLAPAAPLEVDDPVDGDESVFQACFDHISRATDPIVHILTGSLPCQ